MTTPSAGAGRRRILVVEDEYFVAKGLARDFEGLDLEVVGPKPSVAEALACAEAEPLDGAVLDINLRGESGLPIADALMRRGVPFVLVTGYAAEALPPRYAGVTRCEKPSRAESLVAALFGGIG